MYDEADDEQQQQLRRPRWAAQFTRAATAEVTTAATGG